MELAIDVGYSHVKAISTEKRVIIPSIVAPYRNLSLADLSGKGIGHMVEVRKADGQISCNFVGDLAVREGHAASFTLEREKHKHPNHDVLILTAAKVLGAGVSTTLAAGLPVAYYRSQKDDLKRHLESLHAVITLDGNNPSRVSFSEVVIYPQGAGALLTIEDLPDSGLVTLIDVGYKTTDFVTARVGGGPVSRLSGSIETGVFNLYEVVAQEYWARTGAPLAPARIAEVLISNGLITYYGEDINLTDTIREASLYIARNIVDQIQAAMGDRYSTIKRFYLAGGGTLALPDLQSFFPSARVIDDPQWANAEGYLNYARTRNGS